MEALFTMPETSEEIQDCGWGQAMSDLYNNELSENEENYSIHNIDGEQVLKQDS